MRDQGTGTRPVAAPSGAPAGTTDRGAGEWGGDGAALLESAALPVLLVDDEMVVRWANPAAARLHGVDGVERLVGRPVLALVPADEHDAARAAVGEVLGRGARQGRRRVLHATGRPDEGVRLVEERATAVLWEGRTAVLSCLVDVTEQEGERAREAAAARPVAQLAQAGVGFVQVLPSGVVGEANPAAAALAGRPTLTGVRVLELVAPGDRPAVDHLLRALLAPGEPVPPGVLDVRLRVPGGTTRPCRVTGFRLGPPGMASDAAAVALVLVDDADRADALRDAGARAERSAALLRAVPDALVVTGRDGTILQVNDQAEHLFGWTAADLVGQPVEVLVPRAREAGHRRLRDQYVGTPHARPMFTGPGITARRRDGHEVPVEVNLAAAVLDGESVVVASVRDTSEQRRVQDALQASHDLVAGVLGAATEQAILAMDLEGRLELFSRGAERLLGYRAQDVLGGPSSIFDHPDADLRATWGLGLDEPLHERIQALVGSGVSSTRPWAYRTKDGGRRDVLLSVTVRTGPAGPTGLIVVATDITAQLARDEELAASRQRFEAAFTHAPVGVALVDVQPGRAGRFLQVNGAMTRMLGYSAAELLDASLGALAHPDDVGLAESGPQGLTARPTSEVVEHRFLHADGHDVWVELSFAAVQDGHGRAEYAVCMMNDVTDRKRAEAELVHNALHDALTGLPNRALLTEHLHQALVRSRTVGTGAGVLYIDLDNFKDVNDSLGHAAGDQMLAAVAERLLSAVRAPDVAGRLGGDEFVVVLESVVDADGIAAVAERVARALSVQVPVGDRVVQVSASIGVAFATGPDARPEELLREADIAMYRAKANGRGRFEFSDPGLQARALRQIELEADLRAALELGVAPSVPGPRRPGAEPEGQLYLDYQPCFDARDGRMVACEALLRWRHPTRGLLSPGAFLDVAEERALMVPLGAWVLRAACEQAARWWHAHGEDAPEVWVNVSAGQMGRDGFPRRVREALEETGLPARLLVLELTERQALSLSEGVLEDLRALDEMGVRLAIDDFGTGYAGLDYLRKLPVHVLKLDGSYVAAIGRDASGTALAATVVALGRALHLTVVAEGIETAEQRAAVEGFGVDLLQGFLLARPGPVEQVERLVARQAATG